LLCPCSKCLHFVQTCSNVDQLISTSGKNVKCRIVWRIKSIFYFHNEIPKWQTKWPPNLKLATIFKTDKVKGDIRLISHLWAIFVHMHQYINKPNYLLRLAMTGSRNSRWRSSKPEVPIFQLVEKLASRFQIIIPCFRGRAIHWRHFQQCHTTTEVGIQDGGRLNQKYLYCSL